MRQTLAEGLMARESRRFWKRQRMSDAKRVQPAQVAAPNYTWNEEDIARAGRPALWLHQRVTRVLAEAARAPVPTVSNSAWWVNTMLEVALAPLHIQSPLLQPALLHQNAGLYMCRGRAAVASLPADAGSRGVPPLTVVACGAWPKNDGAPSGVWGLVVQADAPPVVAWSAMDGGKQLPGGLFAELVKNLRAAGPQLRLPSAESLAVQVRAPAAVALLMADALSPRPTAHPAAFGLLKELAEAQPDGGWDATMAQLAYLATSTAEGVPRAAELVPLSGRVASLHGTLTRTPAARTAKVKVPPYLRQLARQSAAVEELDDSLRDKADDVLLREFNAVQKCVADWTEQKCDENVLWGALNRLEGFLRMGRYMADRHVYQHVQNTAAMNARAVFAHKHARWLAHGRSFFWPVYTLTAWSARERDGEVDGERLVPVAHVWHLNAGLNRLAELASKRSGLQHGATRRLVDLWLESVAAEGPLDARQVSKQPWNDTLWGTAGSVLMLGEWLQTTPDAELDELWDAQAYSAVLEMLEKLREDVRAYVDHFWCDSAWRASAHLRPDVPGVHGVAISWSRGPRATDPPRTMRALMQELALLDVDGLYAHVYAQLHKALSNDESMPGALFAPQMLESATWRWTYDHETGRLPLIGAKDKIDEDLMLRRMAVRNTGDFDSFRGGAVRETKTLQALFNALAPTLSNGVLPPLKSSKRDMKKPDAAMPLSGLVETTRSDKTRPSRGDASAAEREAWEEMAAAAERH